MNTIEVRTKRKDRNFFYSPLIILLAIFLNQSNVIFGTNISFSDTFLILVLLYLIYKKDLSVPLIPLLFFMLLSITTVFTATFVTPWKYNFSYDIVSIIRNWLKLFVTLLYLILGYNLMRKKDINIIYKYYSIAALVIGFIGIVFSLINIGIMRDTLFYGGFRFRGFMNDPNYFAIIMVTGLAYLIRSKDKSLLLKYIFGFIVFISVSISGSKTGIIVLGLYILFVFAEYMFKSVSSRQSVIKKIFVLLVILLLFLFSIQMFNSFIERVAEIFPIFSRINVLFTNFNAAVNAQGSGRGEAWSTAYKIIKKSPIIGIGIGTYGNVGYLIAGSNIIAHNTFLQLLAEWGTPLTVLFFSYLIAVLIKSKCSTNSENDENLISRDVIIILLFGSMAVSLNNVRILWLSLGSLIYYLKERRAIACIKSK